MRPSRTIKSSNRHPHSQTFREDLKPQLSANRSNARFPRLCLHHACLLVIVAIVAIVDGPGGATIVVVVVVVGRRCPRWPSLVGMSSGRRTVGRRVASVWRRRERRAKVAAPMNCIESLASYRSHQAFSSAKTQRVVEM